MTRVHSIRELEAAEALQALQGRTVPIDDDLYVTFRHNGKRVGRRDFATHWVHWYPAKMFHRIPAIFLDVVPMPPGSHILDPFLRFGHCTAGSEPPRLSSNGY